jgi:uncharacterized protein YerC
VPLKELESWLKRGQNVQLLREICSPKKCIPNIGANIGAITGILLMRKHVRLKEVVSWLKRGQKVPFLREKRPFKKVTPKAGANIGAITEILLKGHISLKNGTYCPLFSHHTTFFKGTCVFLLTAFKL